MSKSKYRLRSEYFDYNIVCSLEELLITLVNLVNIQGPAKVTIRTNNPFCLEEHLYELKDIESWLKWWRQTGKEPVSILDNEEPINVFPCHTLSNRIDDSGVNVGLNVGGSYTRSVKTNDGMVTHNTCTLLQEDGYNNIGDELAVLTNAVDAVGGVRDVRSISIAWSAPRVLSNLVPWSRQMSKFPGLSELMLEGKLNSYLSEYLNVKTNSWNDGEAVAAAEAVNSDLPEEIPTIVIKMGSSIASGMIWQGKVLSLPMQLSKTILDNGYSNGLPHPEVGMVGTARELIGAKAILYKYRSFTGSRITRFSDFVERVFDGDELAHALVKKAVNGISKLVEMLYAMLGPINIILTGKNIEDYEYRQLFYKMVDANLDNSGMHISRIYPSCDVDMVAAIGAIYLTAGIM